MKWNVGTIILTVSGLLILIGVYKAGGPTGNIPTETTNGNGVTCETPRQPKEYTVLLDVSASRPVRMIDEGKHYVDSLIERMCYGDRLFLLQMYEQGVNDPESRLDVTLKRSDEITSLEAEKALNSQRDMLRAKVGQFFQNARPKPVMQTDILSTLSIASEQISSEKRNVLVVLSDMYQSSKEFEFEGLKRMPPKDWIDERKRAGLVRPLRGACVVVVGADPSTHVGIEVLKFWREYFEASGATLTAENYRTTPPPADTMPCEQPSL
jgi:hypothetical protein